MFIGTLLNLWLILEAILEFGCYFASQVFFFINYINMFACLWVYFSANRKQYWL